MGQLWAALLHRAGRSVCLLFRDEERLGAYRAAGGITLHDERGVTLVTPPALVADKHVPVRRLLVATKAHQTMDALGPFASRRLADLTVALLQNGMGAAEDVQALLPQARIYCLVTTGAAWRDAPFSVHRAGHGGTEVGRHGREPGGEDVLEIVRGLALPDLKVEISADIRAAQWRKLAVNCVINPLTALLDIPNGQVPKDARAKTMIAPLCAEITGVMVAEGLAVTAKELHERVEETCRVTADNYNSMRRDLNDGRRTEIDYITGYVLARAAVHGVECPVNESLYEDIKRREARGGAR
jgi:2-dehydropantoate 2-reductase